MLLTSFSFYGTRDLPAAERPIQKYEIWRRSSMRIGFAAGSWPCSAGNLRRLQGAWLLDVFIDLTTCCLTHAAKHVSILGT